jgi:hypothetical protein
MIDVDTVRRVLNGDDTHPDILQALGLKSLIVIEEMRTRMAYAASLIQCRIEGDDIPSSDIRDFLLWAVGMTIEEAMATTDLRGEEE